MAHRYAAGLLYLGILALLIVALRSYKDRPDIKRGVIWAFILVNIQALSGMLNVWTEGQLISVFFHATNIALLFSMLCYLCTEVGFPGRKELEAATVVPEVAEPLITTPGD